MKPLLASWFPVILGFAMLVILNVGCWLFQNRAKREELCEEEEYQKFVEEMAAHCHCARHLRPCESVLAGGVCDRNQEEREMDHLNDYSGKVDDEILRRADP